MQVNPNSNAKTPAPSKETRAQRLEKMRIAAQEKREASQGPASEVKIKKTQESSDKIAIGDVGLNDPNSAETQEKLRHLLKSGGFAFNDRERKALGEILGQK